MPAAKTTTKLMFIFMFICGYVAYDLVWTINAAVCG